MARLRRASAGLSPYCDSPLVGVVEQLLDAGAASKGLDEPPVVDLSEGHYLARMTAIS